MKRRDGKVYSTLEEVLYRKEERERERTFEVQKLFVWESKAETRFLKGDCCDTVHDHTDREAWGFEDGFEEK